MTEQSAAWRLLPLRCEVLVPASHVRVPSKQSSTQVAPALGEKEKKKKEVKERAPRRDTKSGNVRAVSDPPAHEQENKRASPASFSGVGRIQCTSARRACNLMVIEGERDQHQGGCLFARCPFWQAGLMAAATAALAREQGSDECWEVVVCVKAIKASREDQEHTETH